MPETTAPAPPLLLEQFDDLEQQHDTTVLGMWAFLATEVMFFGGLFASYTIFRAEYPGAFDAASRHLSVLLGGINTAVLLCSSLTMALAVRSAQLGARKPAARLLVVTALLGAVFLGIKAVEYTTDYHEGLVPGLRFTHPGAHERGFELFFVLYFIMTGLHAVHLVIGIVLVLLFAFLVWRQWFSGGGAAQVEVAGLYWHFIDIVWVFLYPLLYLVDVHR